METDLHEKYELQALFDLSKALNSSLNLKTILDTILLTPMGKLLIAKGIVLVAKDGHGFEVEALKGLARNMLGRVVEIDAFPDGPTYLKDLPPSAWQALLSKNGIEVVIPILHDGKELGLIGFGKKVVPIEITDSEMDYLHSLSNIAATAVQNGVIFQQLNTSNRKLEKKVQELNTLSEIVRELNSTLSSLDSERVINLLAYSIMGEMMVNRCLIFLGDRGGLTLSLSKGVPEEQAKEFLKPELVEQLQGLNEPIFATSEPDETLSKTLSDAGIAVVVPMLVENKPKGVLALGEKITRLPFVKDELSFLSILGSWSMISIETARLIEQELQKQKLDEELRIASDIQRQLLPETCPSLDGYEIAAINYPSLHVGGDYYDCIKKNDDEYVFCIADVSGKGAPAALIMSNLQASLRVMVDADIPLNEIVQKINKIIYTNTPFDKFITAFFGVLNVKNGEITYVNAGHNPPYLYHADLSFRTLDCGGLILGMMPVVAYEQETLSLVAGDCLVMFTDGVSEAMNAESEEFEEHRIEKCVSDSYAMGAQGVMQHLIDEVEAFSAGMPQADDITVMVIRAL